VFAVENYRGKIFVGYFHKGLSVLKGEKFQSFKLNDGKSLNRHVVTFLNNNDSDLLIGTLKEGVMVFKENRIIKYSEEEGLSSKTVYSIVFGEDEKIWIGTRYGLNILQKDKISVLTKKDGLIGEAVRIIKKDSSGRMWIGYTKGFNVFENGKFRVVGEDKTGLKYTLQSFYEDGDKNIWIGTTENGLLLYKNDKLFSINKMNGLFSNKVYTIFEDRSGVLWMSSNEGIFNANKSELFDLYNGRINRINSGSYGLKDGLRSKDFNGTVQPVGTQTKDGTIWLTTPKGVVSFNPNKFKKNNISPQVFIEEMIIDDKKLEIENEMKVKPSTKRVEFHFTATSLISSKHIKFKYKLEGYDPDWIDSGTKRVAHYMNLSPGDYKFKVIAANTDGVWNRKGASISFHKQAHFYETTLFYILSVISTMLLIFMIYRIRVRSFKKTNKALSRFVPDEFLEFLQRETVVDIQLGDQINKKMTILFSDIRDFTTLSEKLTPEENFNFINSYLTRVGPVIRKNQGFIDKYLGDGIMALFPQHCDSAVSAAIEMQLKVKEYNKHRKKMDYPSIKIGVGLHSGDLMLGTIGEEKRIETTVISDAVNLSARLEELTKYYGVGIIMSQEILHNLENPTEYNFRFLGKVKVKGKEDGIPVFEVFDHDAQTLIDLKNSTKDDFEEGIIFFLQNKFDKSLNKFKKVIKTNPHDKAAKRYIKLLNHAREHGTAEEEL